VVVVVVVVKRGTIRLELVMRYDVMQCDATRNNTTRRYSRHFYLNQENH